MVAKFGVCTQFQRNNQLYTYLASLDTAFMVAEFKEISKQDELYTYMYL